MTKLIEVNYSQWDASVSKEQQDQAINALENGDIVYFPNLAFELNTAEKRFLSPIFTHPSAKNISYNVRTNEMRGDRCDAQDHQQLKSIMQRYCEATKELVANLFPQYAPNIQQERTSYRPVEVKGRKSSYRKNDTRLHVDAFPSAPTRGVRIMRIFSNVNYISEEPRVWRAGECFENVVKRFAPAVKKPLPLSAKLLELLRITKDYRTLYDHYMLNIHNAMKADTDYQQSAQQQEIQFPPGSTWAVFTDQVSHAAMSGQYLFEQTFHLPIAAMADANKAPLKVLERFCGEVLV